MVASPPPRRSPAVAALLVCLMTTVPGLVLVSPPAEAQVSNLTTVMALSIVSGSTHVLDSGNQDSMFFKSGESGHFTAVVRNTGTQGTSTPQVPIYLTFNESIAAVDNPCILVTIPGVDATSPNPSPTLTQISVGFTVPSAPATAAWNATLWVNRVPNKPHLSCPGEPNDYEYHAAPISSAATGPADTDNAASDPITHEATLPFVRDLTIDYRITAFHWCHDPTITPGRTPRPPSNCVDLVDGAQTNVTRNGPNQTVTFFKIDVQNFGDWKGDFDPEGHPWEFPYNVTVAGANVPVSWATKGDGIVSGSGAYIAGIFDLNHKIGNYTVTAKINVDTSDGKALRHMNATGNAARTWIAPIQVAWYDFQPGVNGTDFHDDPANPYPFPFPDGGHLVINGNVSIRNAGPAHANATTGTVGLRAWIDAPGGDFDENLTDDNLVPEVGNWSSPTTYVHFAFKNPAQSSYPSSGQYLSPGKHLLYVEADNATLSEGAFAETNESNNLVVIPIYVKQTAVPTFNKGVPQVTAGWGPESDSSNPQVTARHPHENFTVHADVTEGPKDAQSDTEDLTVVANFTLATNRSVYQTYNLTYRDDTVYASSPEWIANVTNFSFVGNGSAEDWLLTIEATDPFGRFASASWDHRLHLEKWPIQTLNDTDILTAISRDSHEYNMTAPREANWVIPKQDSTPTYWLTVYRNWTGFISNDDPQNDQILKVDNLHATFWPPRNQSPLFTDFQTAAGCDNAKPVPVLPGQDQAPTTGPDGNPWNGTAAGTGGCSSGGSTASRYNFSSIEAGPTTPGVWGVDIQIRDLSGEVRHVLRNFTLQDQAPVFSDLALSDFEDPLNMTNHSVPGHHVQIHANATDDSDLRVVNTYAVWTLKDHSEPSFNFTLHNTTPQSSSYGGVTSVVYNDTFAVGRDRPLNASGIYEVRFVSVDVNGNWASSAPVEFTLNDTARPSITSRGVEPTQQELRQNVTFFAKVSYLYAPRVTLTVTDQNNVVVIDAARMNVTAGAGDNENFTYVANFSTPGTYTYAITAYPSQGAPDPDHGTLGGSFSVSENLGPRIEVKSPTVSVNGQLYAPAAPTLTFLVYDAQGVDNSTFRLTVDGQPVQDASISLSPAPSGLNGYYFTYTVFNGAGSAFENGQVVPVNVTVFDKTGLQPGKTSLESFLNFTFIVDSSAPTARLSDFAPRYKSGASQLWNVSLNSRFTITASNDDGSPVPVDRVMYSILGGGRSVTATYNGPFSMADNKDAYAGATVYTLSVWAYDAVGNSNASHPTQYSFFLDDEPPHLALPLVQDRWLNFTIVDEQTGVKSVTLWARADNDPYQPYPMVKDPVGDVWRGVLPQGQRGQTLTYYVQAVDNVDNNADGTESFGSPSSPYGSYKVANHEPVVSFTAPALGSRISRVVDLTWDASDVDADALTFTLFYKAPGKDAYTELAKLDSSTARRYSLDTSKLADGEYTFRVSASDGTAVSFSETTVTIINSGSAIGAVGPVGPAVSPGDLVLLTAEIRKAGATVEAQLYRGGTIVDSYAMHDDGKDGDAKANDQIYSARVPVPASGDYSVTIVAHYNEDGQAKESTLVNAASFSAKLTPGYVLATYAGLLVLLALLAVVGVAIAIFVVVRRKG